jgi:hypothetical protein
MRRRYYHYIFRRLGVISSILLIILSSCGSKKGCIDPYSLSFDPEAKIDDGSCTYPEYQLTPSLIKKLKNKFSETSGLQYFENRIWTFNDAGGTNSIYSIDTADGGEKEEIVISGVTNIDFEAMAEGPEYFYLGDIGNNDGNRTDLVIYRLPKIAEASLNNNNTLVPDIITFRYSDQKDFRKNPDSDYDCEAMIYFNEHLYLFTKNHANNQTNLYEVPAIPGDHTAKLKGIFDSHGLITDADINTTGDKVVLIGHDAYKTRCFLWILKNFNQQAYFAGEKILIEIGNYQTIGQVEGDCFYNTDSLYISNEQDGNLVSNLFGLNIGMIK